MVTYQIKHLSAEDIDLMQKLLNIFEAEFNDTEVYGSKRPDDNYIRDLLNSNGVITLIAYNANNVMGGLVAYELKKFEQRRSEIYIYDLAVSKEYWRQGIATALINALKPIARDRGAWVIFVQADYSDEPAVKLYTKMGTREDVLHFDIPVKEISDKE
jgi:aminoglycoside 3-N-acetyltransferase I